MFLQPSLSFTTCCPLTLPPANLVTFYMICFRKCGMSDTARVYLSCLAVVDIFYLVWVILIDLTLTFWLQQPFWHAHPWCNILGFLQYGALYSSSWIVVVFTVERYLVLSSTAAQRRFSQVRVTKVTCATIVLVSHAASVPMAWINKVTFVSVNGNTTVPRCLYREQTYSTAIVWVTTFLSGGVPIVLVLVFNYLMGYHLCRARNLFTKEERRSIHGGASRAALHRSVFLLGTVSVVFVVLSLPRFITYCILRTAHNHGTFDRNDYGLAINVAGDVANMLQNLNSATNFLLYCVVSRRFRQELLCLLCCRATSVGDFSSALARTTTRVFSVAQRKTTTPPSDPVAMVLTKLRATDSAKDLSGP